MKSKTKGRRNPAARPLLGVAREPIGAGEVAGEGAGEVAEESAVTVFKNIPANAYVRLYRRDPSSKKFNYICRLAPSEATEETVLEFFGGGEYWFQEVAFDDSGASGLKRQVKLVFEGPPKAVTRYPSGQAGGTTTPASDGSGAAPAGVSAAGGGAGRIGTQEVMDILKLRLLEEKRHGGMDLGAVATIVAALAPVLKELFARKEPLDAAALVEKITAALHKSEAASSPVAQFKDMAEAMNAVLDLKERAGDLGGETADPLLKLATENLPRLLDVIQDGMARKGGKVTVDEVRKQLAPGQTATLAADAPMWQRFVVANKKLLLGAALSGKRPDIQAAFAFDMLPDTVRGSVRDLMAAHVTDEGPNAADQIIGLVPEFAAHRNWVQEFCDYLAGQFFPPEEEASAGGALPAVDGGGA